MATADVEHAYLARRAEQEAVLAVQAPPGAAREAHQALCLTYSRRLADRLRADAGVPAGA